MTVTAIWVIVGLPLRLVVAYLAALGLNQRLPAIGLFRTIFYLPAVVSGVAIALLWVWILQPQYGLLNSFLRLFGMTGPAWLGSEEWAQPPRWIPARIRLENYVEAFTAQPFAQMYFNTTIITVSASFGQLVSATLVGFGFARLRAPGRNLLFALLISTMLLSSK